MTTKNAALFRSIPDLRLRETVCAAIARAEAKGYPIFVALGYAVGAAECFGATLPDPLPEFLRGCARFSFSRKRTAPDLESRVAASCRPRDYAIADRTLNTLLQTMIGRVILLDFECFAGLRIPGADPECTTVCWLPADAAAHLSLCFRVAAGSGLAPQSDAPMICASPLVN